MDYDITIRVSGNEKMVGIEIQQGGTGKWLDYGGCDPKDIPIMVERAVQEFLTEVLWFGKDSPGTVYEP